MLASALPPLLLVPASVHDPCHEAVASRGCRVRTQAAASQGPGVDRLRRAGWVRSNARRRPTPGIFVSRTGIVVDRSSKLRASGLEIAHHRRTTHLRGAGRCKCAPGFHTMVKLLQNGASVLAAAG